MSKSPIDYILHIRDECLFIVSELNEDTDQNSFTKDETLKRAVVRSLEIIGEATKQISQDFRKEYPDIPWKNMAGMRDRLIHNYMGVNYLIVYDVGKHMIPDLLLKIQIIIRKFENQ